MENIDNILSLLFYLLLTATLMTLCKGKGQSKRRNESVFIAYIILFIVAGIRFGIGNDYADYAPDCIYTSRYFATHSIIDSFHYFVDDIELAHLFICWLVKWMRYPFVGLYLIYSLLQVFLLFLILKKDNEHFWGLFLFIIGEFMFFSWDAIRQYTAILLVTYSYIYAKDGNFIKFLICIALAWLFHHSALYLAPLFFLRWVKINRWILVGILSFVTIVAVSGIIQQYQENIALYFELIEGYERYAVNESTTIIATSNAYKIRLLLVGVFYLFILIFQPRGRPLYELLLTIGASIFIFATNSITIMRISWYFWTIAIVMIGPAFREMKRRKMFWLSLVLIAMIVTIFSHDVLTGSSARGCQIYTTIFTNDLNHLPQK